MPATRTTSARKGGKEATMAATTLTVDLSKTVGQSSAIEANGSPLFSIRVTHPARQLPPTKAGEPQSIPGFGRVVSAGPVKGYEVLYTLDSVV
jgi:hypothetical protein